MSPTGFNAELGRQQFLHLLVTQLQHQDPLSPVDQQEMISQLAQFSVVEGMERLNVRFDDLVKLQTLSQGADLVGRHVEYRSPSSDETAAGRVERAGQGTRFEQPLGRPSPVAACPGPGSSAGVGGPPVGYPAPRMNLRSHFLAGRRAHRVRLALWLMLCTIAALGACAPDDTRDAVHIGHAEGMVNNVMERYIDRVIDHAERTGARAVVIRIDTPGGEIGAMKAIAGRIERSEVPVITWVGPPGAQAASAGTFMAAIVCVWIGGCGTSERDSSRASISDPKGAAAFRLQTAAKPVSPGRRAVLLRFARVGVLEAVCHKSPSVAFEVEDKSAQVAVETGRRHGKVQSLDPGQRLRTRLSTSGGQRWVRA
jgi:flagellar basal-body rod modification protein FlgD